MIFNVKWPWVKDGTVIGPREKQKIEFYEEKGVAALFSMDRSKQIRIIFNVSWYAKGAVLFRFPG